MKLRHCDAHGCGYFGAPRGGRNHNGVDILAAFGDCVRSPVDGVVTKVGYPYADDLSFRYVQISAGGYDFRLFYCEPTLSLGAVVKRGDAIGTAQDLGKRYAGIANHFHLEIKNPDGNFVDPTPVALAMGAS